ncbi:MAG: lysine transporter LysE, partial [Cryomorphaceae bacterium]|nr:lysine transporter LysE [Cryomorphaceae bacterium]
IGYLSKLLSKYLQSDLIWRRINLFIITFMSILALYVLIEIIKFF